MLDGFGDETTTVNGDIFQVSMCPVPSYYMVLTPLDHLLQFCCCLPLHGIMK